MAGVYSKGTLLRVRGVEVEYACCSNITCHTFVRNSRG